MITGLILSFLATVVTDLLGVLPSVPVPSWLTNQDSAMNNVFGFIDSMGVWFPTGLLMTVLTAYFAIKLTAFGIKIIRIVISHITGGGGSAA